MKYDTKARMCFNKHAYGNEYKAIRAALRSSRAFGKPMRWYKCPHCGLYHLTSLVDGEGE